MSEQAKCKGCGADILWAVTEAGKRIPLNQPEKRFILVQKRELQNGLRTGPYYLEARMVETCTSHFSDCPKAAEFRKQKEQD